MILLTGFEPFGGDRANPSIGAARRAAELLNDTGQPATAVELPCVFADAPAALRYAMDAYRPDLVVCTGLNAAADGVRLERAALNLVDARIPDNAGAQPVDVPVVPGGPAAYFTTLPVKRALAALRDAGVPVQVSHSAGTYVCNQVFYALMHALADDAGGTRGGFVHVPPTGADGADPELLARALVLVAREALDHATDISLAAGTLA
ncbi:pyroglutamyl-peptidase I [Arthrobacter sp. JSM 101049]|uniref:pyroglutamyl-peptidase I family protein n=1 Tax=Arthrobacter sp. JSM 101049 TaxID=929097 RepID=UPI003567F937